MTDVPTILNGNLIAPNTLPGASVVSGSIGNTQVGLAASATGAPANPTGTTSTTAVMMGLAIPFTPAKTGIVKVTLSGEAANNTAGDGATVQLAYGTGAAPANGATATGTAVGTKYSVTSSAAGQLVPFTAVARVSGLTVGTAIWVDLQVAAVTGGTASVSNLSYIVEELLA